MHYALEKVAAREGAASLTARQRMIVTGIHSGLMNKQIADRLGITEATVKAHMTSLMRKFAVRNRTQLALATHRLNVANDGRTIHD